MADSTALNPPTQAALRKIWTVRAVPSPEGGGKKKRAKLAARALGSSVGVTTQAAWCTRGGRRLVLSIFGPMPNAGIKATLQMIPLHLCVYTQLPSSEGEFAVMKPGGVMP